MKKGIKKFAVTILLILLISSMALVFVGCDKDKYPEYEIKLFDDNWNELKKQINRRGEEEYIDSYIYDYDGSHKCFNAIAYNYGKEIYRLDYKTYNYGSNEILLISVIKRPEIAFTDTCKSINDLPIDVGIYQVRFHFFTEGQNKEVCVSKETATQEIQIKINEI